MKKKILVIALMTLVLLTGCMKNEKGEDKTTTTTHDIEKALKDEKEKYGQYRMYKDDDLLVTVDQYNKVLEGMTEEEIWQIIGGKCKNQSGSNNDSVSYKSYNCNGKGSDFATVMFMFNQGKLQFKIQNGLATSNAS